MKCKIERQQQASKDARHQATKKVRQSVFRRHSAYPCAYCGRMLHKHEATGDHVHPVSQGGTNKRRNIAIACVDCNSRKGSMNAADFRKLVQRTYQ